MEYLNNNDKSMEKSLKLLECAKKAVEATHTLIKVKKRVDNIYDAIKTKDKDAMWCCLQDNLINLRKFINDLSGITSFYVQNVDENFYNNVTINELENQLKIVINFIYLKEGLHSVSKKAFKENLKKMLNKTGLFTDRELDLL